MASLGQEGAPKKKIVLATHSHLFLDRDNIQNNFIVFKDHAGNAEIRQVRSEQELHSLVFKLLGNSPSDIFLPKNIIIVEGRSDHEFLNALIKLKGGSAIAVHFADGVEKVGNALTAIDQMLKSVSYQPIYRDKICIMVDSSADSKIVGGWGQYIGDHEGKRILMLKKNGIEYYYPTAILKEITEIPEEELESKLTIYLQEASKNYKSEPSLGKFVGNKVSLARAVAAKLQKYHLSEVEPAIITLLEEAKSRALP